jgi:hypothetical protein
MEQDQKEKDQKQEDKWVVVRVQNLLVEVLEGVLEQDKGKIKIV